MDTQSTLTARERAFLQEPQFATLATVSPDGSPHLTVIWYLLDGDEIMFSTTTDRRKSIHLRRDTRTALLAFDAYRFVRVSGRARESATGQAAVEDIIGRLAIRYDVRYDDDGLQRLRAQARVSYRFAISRVYSSANLR